MLISCRPQTAYNVYLGRVHTQGAMGTNTFSFLLSTVCFVHRNKLSLPGVLLLKMFLILNANNI